MIQDNFKIYLDRLGENDAQKIQSKVSPAFIQVEDKDLSFPEEVTFEGETYLSDGFFILQLKIQTTAFVPCLMCNEKIKIPIIINDFYLSEKVSELRSTIFDFTEELRSSILVKVPEFFECNGGNCPERETAKKYLKPQ